MTTIDQPADGFAPGPRPPAHVPTADDTGAGGAGADQATVSDRETDVPAVEEASPAAAAPAVPGSPAAESPVARRIAAEVASVATLSELPLAEHADAYQRVHVELQRALAEIDGA